ncbi:hypothetical protein KA977_02345 [Candidatus Dependentiae bacterium]|nr:hypothetical protein [Candidatus Dependentiae bacterium]
MTKKYSIIKCAHKKINVFYTNELKATDKAGVFKEIAETLVSFNLLKSVDAAIKRMQDEEKLMPMEYSFYNPVKPALGIPFALPGQHWNELIENKNINEAFIPLIFAGYNKNGVPSGYSAAEYLEQKIDAREILRLFIFPVTVDNSFKINFYSSVNKRLREMEYSMEKQFEKCNFTLRFLAGIFTRFF